jgi:hypothetical protein
MCDKETAKTKCDKEKEDKDWQVKGNASQKASAMAAILSFCIAFVAVVFVWRQIENNRQITRETTARQIFRQHLELAINKPQLALPPSNPDEQHRTQYEFFVTHLLFTCEEIVAAFPGDQGWKGGCASQMKDHKTYICTSVVTETLEHYSDPMQILIKSICEDKKSEGKAIR